MKWAKRLLLVFLVVLVIGLTGFLGRNLWVLHEEQREFTALSERIEEERRNRDNREGTQTGRKTGTQAETKRQTEVTKDAEKGLSSGAGVMPGEELAVKRMKEDILPEYQEIYGENPDFAGWMMIEGTKINYPIMQTLEEPEYYIHRDFNREFSYAGTPFVGSGDVACDSDLFLYGHNMRNGTMFADLLKYQNEDYWKAHPVIALTTLWEHQEYEIFTAFHASEEEWAQEDGRFYQAMYGRGQKKEWAVLALKAAGAYDTGITPKPGTPLLYLVTCSYGRDGDRYVVAGARKKSSD